MKPGLFAILLAATAAIPAVPALAQGQAQAPAADAFPPAPPIADPKPFTLPASERFTLPNGMTVTLIPYGVAPKTVVSLRIGAGDAMAPQPWLARLTAEMMREGAGGRSAADLATAAAAMGSDLDVGAGLLGTSVRMDVLSEHAADAIALIGDVAMRADLPADALARVKANLGRNLSVALSQPGTLANIAMVRTVYGPDHPFGRVVPTPAQLQGYSIDAVRGFYRDQFGAKRASLYIAGRFDAAAVKAAVTRVFGGWAAGPAPTRIDAPHQPGPKLVLVDRPGAPQTTLRLVYDAPVAGSAGDIPMRVANDLLGGAFSSRITTNIREDKGYTYSPGSGIDFNPGEALWAFEADVTTKDTGAALHEVFKEVRRMQTEAPGEDEARGIRTYMAGSFAIRNSTAAAVVSTLTQRDVLGLPADWTERYVPAVLAVTPAQMQAAVATNLPLDKATLVVVGDLKTVEPQLKAQPELANLPVVRPTVP